MHPALSHPLHRLYLTAKERRQEGKEEAVGTSVPEAARTAQILYRGMFWVYRNGSNFPSDVDDVCFQSAGWRAAVWIPGTSARGTSFPTARVCIGVDLQSKDMCGCMWMCIMHVGTCEYMWMCVDAHGRQVCVCVDTCGYM